MMRKPIEIAVTKGGRVVYEGGWDTLEELQRERLPQVFAEHLAKRLEETL